MSWYVEFDFIDSATGKIPMCMKTFKTESEAIMFAELETTDGEIGYMEELQ